MRTVHRFSDELQRMHDLIREARPELETEFLSCRTPEALVAFFDKRFPRPEGTWGFVALHRASEELRRVISDTED